MFKKSAQRRPGWGKESHMTIADAVVIASHTRKHREEVDDPSQGLPCS
jgi:hypothetical protein